jgi:hypothetical protein
MKLSFLLIILGGLLAATSLRWSQIWDRRPMKQIYQDIKVGKQRSTLYQKIAAPVSFALVIVGLYLAFTWR